MLKTNHWLKDSKNVQLLQLTQPWDALALAPTVPPPFSETMRAWTVDELASFYLQQDARGLADALRKNAVNGADLLQFATWQSLQEDLNVVPFAAKKILRLRDGFLDGSVSVF